MGNRSSHTSNISKRLEEEKHKEKTSNDGLPKRFIDFSTETLFHSCALQCNPSSIRQALLRGSRENDVYELQQKWKKMHCVHACGDSAKEVATSGLNHVPPEVTHASVHLEVLSSVQKKDVIVKMVRYTMPTNLFSETLAGLKDKRDQATEKCSVRCAQYRDISSGELECLKGCAEGTHTFYRMLIDLL
eukprot:1366831-Amorphochlora_amoeboformis.AAC.2